MYHTEINFRSRKIVKLWNVDKFFLAKTAGKIRSLEFSKILNSNTNHSF